jgi:hypothetical protein
MVFRGVELEFAILSLIRGTLSLLNYTTIGLAPAMVRLLAEAGTPKRVLPVSDQPAGGAIEYHTPPPAEGPSGSSVVYLNGLVVALISANVGLCLTAAYPAMIEEIHTTGRVGVKVEILCMGIGLVLRLASEAPGAVIQTARLISRDNAIVIVAEFAWVFLALALAKWRRPGLEEATGAFMCSGALLLAFRMREASLAVPLRRGQVQSSVMKRLVAMGAIIGVAQLADFLYAPTDYILIGRLISVTEITHYAPAVQIDAGLMLLVAAVAAVLLPRAALAHTSGNHEALRRYFVRGTLGSAGVLLLAALVVNAVSSKIFTLWLGDPLPRTQAILPLVLIHTVVGGSASVGRSILLAMGKAKAFAVATLAAGAANVILSYCFVKFGGLGLNGIIYGTIVAVIARCAIWQPWYVMRTLRREAAKPIDAVDVRTAALPEVPL